MLTFYICMSALCMYIYILIGTLLFCRNMIVILMCKEGQTTPSFAFNGEPDKLKYVSISNVAIMTPYIHTYTTIQSMKINKDQKVFEHNYAKFVLTFALEIISIIFWPGHLSDQTTICMYTGQL